MVDVLAFPFSSPSAYFAVALGAATCFAACVGYRWESLADGSEGDILLIFAPGIVGLAWPLAPIWMSAMLAHHIGKRRRAAKVPTAHTVRDDTGGA